MRRHVSRHGDNGRWLSSQRPTGGVTVAGLAVALLLIAFAAGGLPGSPLAPSEAQAAPLPAGTDTPTPTNTPTATATATATPTPPPPTLTLVSPTAKQGQPSAQGPSGAYLTVTGANFTTAQVTIYASRQATCSAPQATLASIGTSNGGFPADAFVWPTTLSPGQYYICGTGMTAGAPGYYELTSAPPTLALSTAEVQPPGQAVTITGSNFLGATSVDVTLHSGSTVHVIQSSVTPGGNGSFSIQYVPDTGLAGEVQIVAASPPESGATPALQASVFLNVLPAGTATVGITPTAQSTQAVSKPVPPKNHSDNTGLLALIAAIVIGLLIVLGVIAFFILRGRTGGSPAPGYPGMGGPGVYGRGYSGSVPTANGRRLTGRPLGSEAGVDGAYGQALKVGAVAQWEDEPRPGPDWQPRPMSGHRRYEETPLPGYGDDYPTDASRSAEAGGYNADDYLPEAAPPDPWADRESTDDLSGGRGATNPANYPDEEWTQVQPRLRAPDPTDWHNEPGPGMTRPDNVAEDGARETERGATTEDTKDTELH